MNSSFALIRSLLQFLDPLDAQWFVSGGWAIDIHLNQITRKRGDLDISVPFSDRQKCIEFFLKQGWRIEGKLGGGFKTLRKLADYGDDIHYFWSFLEGAEFISEYIDENRNRRIAYNRAYQSELDYIEVFFDLIEDNHFVFRDFPEVKRYKKEAILEKEGVKYLAPEAVLLLKSRRLSEKNTRDFNVVVGSMHSEAISWLIEALTLVHGSMHPWLEELKLRGNTMGHGG
jgi:hypothetical protein